MSITSAQLIPQVTSVENPGLPGRSTPNSIPAAARTAKSPPESFASPVSSAPQLSTDIRVDNHHQVYYEFVDDRTGDVLFEIPPEALRAIGESLNLPVDGDPGGHSVDLNS